jgi:hypothetical protein
MEQEVSFRADISLWVNSHPTSKWSPLPVLGMKMGLRKAVSIIFHNSLQYTALKPVHETPDSWSIH